MIQGSALVIGTGGWRFPSSPAARQRIFQGVDTKACPLGNTRLASDSADHMENRKNRGRKGSARSKAVSPDSGTDGAAEPVFPAPETAEEESNAILGEENSEPDLTGEEEYLDELPTAGPEDEDAVEPEEEPVYEEEEVAYVPEEEEADVEEEARPAPARGPGGDGRPRVHGTGNRDTSSSFYRRVVRPILSWRLPLPLSILDRYILESFFTPLVIIFCGFAGIWVIIDLTDNLEDFINAKVSVVDVLMFYASQLPQFALVGIQISLLLAILYCLSRLSRTHELVAMLSAGRSVPRILLPIFIIGIIASLGSLGLSYKLAPWANAEKEARLNALIRGEKRQPLLYGTLYRNRYDNRTWQIRRMSMTGLELSRVHIMQQDADGDVIYTMIVKAATYRPLTNDWFLDSVTMNFYDKEGNVMANGKEYRRYLTVRGWRETPKLIVGSNQNAENMGVPELRQYLTDNADFPDEQLAPFRTMLYYRWALPWACMAVVLFGAPLGMAFSRGGIMSNIATAIFLWIALYLGQEVFMALGKGMRLDPWVAAWLPNIGMGLIGLYFLGLRSANRDLPKLNLYGLYNAVTGGK